MDIKKLFIKRKPVDYILYSVVILAGVILDQITKWLAVKFLLPLGHSVPIFKGVLQLTYVENEGAAFGSFKDAPWVFNSVSVVAIIAILVYLFFGRGTSRLQEIALAMIVSGGIGNMIDRTLLQYVIDFIDFCLIDFAVFNGADSFVCVGAGLLILSLVIEIVNESKAEKAKRLHTESESKSEGAE